MSDTGGVWRSGKRVHDLTMDEAVEQGIPAQVWERIQRRKKKFNEAARRKQAKQYKVDNEGKK